MYAAQPRRPCLAVINPMSMRKRKHFLAIWWTVLVLPSTYHNSLIHSPASSQHQQQHHHHHHQQPHPSPNPNPHNNQTSPCLHEPSPQPHPRRYTTDCASLTPLPTHRPPFSSSPAAQILISARAHTQPHSHMDALPFSHTRPQSRWYVQCHGREGG